MSNLGVTSNTRSPSGRKGQASIDAIKNLRMLKLDKSMQAAKDFEAVLCLK